MTLADSVPLKKSKQIPFFLYLKEDLGKFLIK